MLEHSFTNMVNFVDNPQVRGDELNGQVLGLIHRSEGHREHYDRWNTERKALTEKFKETFHKCFHNAFQALGELTSAILACSDEELNLVTCEADIPESAVTTRNLFQQVRAARVAFHRLSDCSESGLRDIFSRYSQEVFVEESGFYHLEKDLDAAYDNISAEYHRADEKRAEYWWEYERARDDYDDLSRNLEAYDNLVWIEKIFAKDAREQYGDRWRSLEKTKDSWNRMYSHMQEFKELIGRLLPKLRHHSDTLKQIHKDSVVIENNLIDMKTAAYEVHRKIGAMENCLLNSDMEVSVEEATRHVLRLTYVSVEMVENDGFAHNLSNQILSRVSEKFGYERTEELKHERQYLALEI